MELENAHAAKVTELRTQRDAMLEAHVHQTETMKTEHARWASATTRTRVLHATQAHVMKEIQLQLQAEAARQELIRWSLSQPSPKPRAPDPGSLPPGPTNTMTACRRTWACSSAR